MIRRSLVLCLAVSACARQDTEIAKGPPKTDFAFHRKEGGTPEEDGWYDAKSTGGGFSIQLPGQFNDFSKASESTNGGKIMMFGIGRAPVGGGVKYTAVAMVSLDDKGLPSSKLEDMASRAKTLGTLRSKRTVTLEGISGIELHITESGNSAKMRGFDRDNTRYSIIAEFPSSEEPDVIAEVDRVLNSLRIALPKE